LHFNRANHSGRQYEPGTPAGRLKIRRAEPAEPRRTA
jgi:hypothetical protein